MRKAIILPECLLIILHCEKVSEDSLINYIALCAYEVAAKVNQFLSFG